MDGLRSIFRSLLLLSFLCVILNLYSAEASEVAPAALESKENQKRSARNVETKVNVAANPTPADYGITSFQADTLRKRRQAPTGCKCGRGAQPPVCTTGGFFPNQCWARCEGHIIIDGSHCSHPLGSADGFPTHRERTVSNRIGCPCTKIYMPVCGEDGITYPNQCLAQCARVNIIASGTCAGEYSTKSCPCTLEYFPVCGIDGVAYSNRCLLECSGMPYSHTVTQDDGTLIPCIPQA